MVELVENYGWKIMVENLGTIKLFWIIFESKKFNLIKLKIDSFLRKEMVSSTKTSDVSKFGKKWPNGPKPSKDSESSLELLTT